MIHTLLSLTRPLIVLDCETTGMTNARIVELGFQRFVADGMNREYRTLVNPEMPIPERATEIHHITDEDVRDAPTFRQLAPHLVKGFTDCDFAGKSVRFDLRVTADEMQRVGQVWSYADANIICVDRLEQLGEPRDLTSLYKRRTGKDLVDAHTALNDVRATTEVLVAQLQQFTKLPRDLSMLHRLQWPDWASANGKFRFNAEGQPIVTFGKHRDKPMNQVDRGYYEWILKSEFDEETKQIARNALLGIFPERV